MFIHNTLFPVIIPETFLTYSCIMLKKIKHTLKILRCEQDFLTLLRSMNVMKLSPDKLLRIHLTFLITFIMDLFLFSKSLLVKVTLGHCPSSVLG